MHLQIVGELSTDRLQVVKACLEAAGYTPLFCRLDELGDGPVISVDKQASCALQDAGIPFYNWDLLFAILGPNDQAGMITDKLEERIRILKAVERIQPVDAGSESHASIRVHDLAESSRFYCWLYGVPPKEWTHRYVTIHRPEINLNLVLLVADGLDLHHDTLYHLGVGVETKEQVVAYYHSAVANGFHIEKPPRTTWRGTPLHELWLKDPDGTLIEVYARLTAAELAQMPADKEPVFLVPGTKPQ
jgi:catechol 2,3-dioxygenase-like lactoylglutathione lyase family enzyme